MKIMICCGMVFCFGLLSSAGVFTVLAAVGMIPRFAGRYHTAAHNWHYENMVVFGTILGGLCSLFPQWISQAAGLLFFRAILGKLVMVLYGLFSGMFVGALALTIAELLDSIPIFARRTHYTGRVKYMVQAIALGKVCGSFIYFVAHLS